MGLKNIMRKLPTRLAHEHTEIHLDTSTNQTYGLSIYFNFSEKGILIDFQVDPNSQDINLSNNKYSTLLGSVENYRELIKLAHN